MNAGLKIRFKRGFGLFEFVVITGLPRMTKFNIMHKIMKE